MWLLPRYRVGRRGRPVVWDLLTFPRNSGVLGARSDSLDAQRAGNRQYEDLGAGHGLLDPRLCIDSDSTDPPFVVISARLPDLVAACRVGIEPGRVAASERSGLRLDWSAPRLC